jgi:predicted nucleic acid-binding Zn ribbon protein
VSRGEDDRRRAPPARSEGGSGGAAGPSRVGDLLDGFLERRGVKEEVERASVVEEWPDRVGERIARVTRARSVSERTLIVEVRSSAWLMELNMLKGQILERVNREREQAPLEKLVFVLSPEDERPRR